MLIATKLHLVTPVKSFRVQSPLCKRYSFFSHKNVFFLSKSSKYTKIM